MPPAAAKPIAPRKRTRKRKRRAASSSESSSSSSSSESEAEALPTTKKVLAKPVAQEDSSSESSSESSSDSESEPEQKSRDVPSITLQKSNIGKPQWRSPSPSPLPSKIPSFLPAADSVGQDGVEHERIMQERFRKFWMSSIADGFKSDLEEIRKESNLGPSRLSLLIDSLASGAEVFTSSSNRDQNAINEVEVILE